MKELLLNFLKCSVLILFISCSISAPVLNESEWEIYVIDDKDRDIVYEQLSIFFNIYDEDGEDDIETIFLIDDKNGLYWELNESNWDYKYLNGVRWIGSDSIVMPDRSEIRRVPLRVFIRDMAGESIEDRVFISKSKIKTDDLKLPDFQISSDKYSISNYKECEIELIEDNKIVKKGRITDEPNSFFAIFGKNPNEFGNYLSVNLIIDDGNIKIKSGPWEL